MKALILISLLTCVNLQAGVFPGQAWEGKVVSWDSETVTLMNDTRKFQVPRSEFGKFKLKEKQFVRAQNGKVEVRVNFANIKK